MNIFPPIRLDAAATPWAKEVQRRIQRLDQIETRLTQTLRNFKNASSSSLALLSNQVKTLTAVANVQYAEWSSNAGVTNFSGWYATKLASVKVASPTGRLEVGFGGSMNSGNGFFCYSVTGDKSGTIVDRNTVLNNYAQRVGVSGGASFIGSGFNTVIVSVPANETLTVSAELNAAATTTYFFGARILARPAP